MHTSLLLTSAFWNIEGPLMPSGRIMFQSNARKLAFSSQHPMTAFWKSNDGFGHKVAREATSANGCIQSKLPAVNGCEKSA